MSVPKAIIEVATIIKTEAELLPETEDKLVIPQSEFRDSDGVLFSKEKLGNILRKLQELKTIVLIDTSDLRSHKFTLQSDKIVIKVSRAKLEKLISQNAKENHFETKSSKSGGKLKFLDKEASLIMGDKRCSLPPYKNEHFLCRAMFKHPKNKPIDWSEAFEEITGYYEDSYGKPPKTKANYHRVYDPARQINRRVKKDLGIEELFRWRELTITRLH